MNLFKKYRIAQIEYDHMLGGKRKAFAVQKRIGLFLWYTAACCDSVAMCETYIKNTRNKKETTLNVLRYL